MSAEGLLIKTSSLTHLYQIRKLKYELQQKAGKFSDAAVTVESLFNLKDTILLLQKRDQVYELEAKYETEKSKRKYNY